MERGYLKLWRRSLDSKVFSSDGLWRLWTYCLMRATFKRRIVPITTGRGVTEIELLPGQLIYGRHAFAEALGWKPSTVRNRMEKLKNMQKVDIKKDSHYSIISIINWDSYQPKENKEDRQEDRQRTGKGQAKDTNKNVKKDKKGKNVKEIRDFLPKEITNDLWQKFKNHRTKLKSGMTDYAEILMAKKLTKFKSEGLDPIDLIERTIERGWKDINPQWIYKDNGGKNGKGKPEGFAGKHYKGSDLDNLAWNQD